MASVDHETEQATKKILESWYGRQANNWTITDRTVMAVAGVLKLSGECSYLFKFVPHPAKSFSGIGVITGIAMGYASDGIKKAVLHKEYYNTCVKQAAADMREEIFRTTY